MIILYVILFSIFLFLVILLVFGGRPYVHKNIHFDNLEGYIAVLLKRGHNEGFMVIELDKRKDLFIKFSKYIKSNRKGLKLSFPGMGEHSNKYAEFVKCTKEMGLKPETNVGSFDDAATTMERIVTLDFERDVKLASQFATVVFEKVFEANPLDTLRLHYVNVDARDIEI
jgi:hypothetical protein